MQATRSPLMLPQYERIFKVIYSALDGRAKTENACIFFTLTGALILQEHYGLDCQPFAGAALLNIGDSSNTVISFGKFQNGYLTSSKNAFHCWIETEHHAIDFMSPIYQENLQGRGYSGAVPRYMFQRELTGMVDSLNNIEIPRSYALQQDPDLSNELFNAFLEHEASMNLLTACKRWFKPFPEQIASKMFRSEEGRAFEFSLKGPDVEGVW